MATSDPSESSWTVVLRRQPGRLVEGQPEGGYPDMLRSSAATAVTIPAWITARSHLGFSWSAGPTRSRPAWQPASSTSGRTST